MAEKINKITYCRSIYAPLTSWLVKVLKPGKEFAKEENFEMFIAERGETLSLRKQA